MKRLILFIYFIILLLLFSFFFLKKKTRKRKRFFRNQQLFFFKKKRFRNRIHLDEITTFKPDPNDPENKTILTLEGSVAVHVWGIASAVESIVVSAYVS